MSKVAEDRSIGLAQLHAPLFALCVIRFRDVNGYDTEFMAG
jgi:hypothetical protein